MTTDQQEQQILTLIYKLPIIRRVRLALTILKGVEPEHIEVAKGEAWETPTFFEELDRRYEDMINGKDVGVPAEDVFKQIEARLK